MRDGIQKRKIRRQWKKSSNAELKTTVSQKSSMTCEMDEVNEKSQCLNNSLVPQAIIRPVPHATSLDTITKKPKNIERDSTPVQPCRGATLSSKNTCKNFPNASSESDLQRYRANDRSHSKERTSPSLGAENIRHKYSLQDNGSAKLLQGALHTPNMGEKVAQNFDSKEALKMVERIAGETEAVSQIRNVQDYPSKKEETWVEEGPKFFFVIGQIFERAKGQIPQGPHPKFPVAFASVASQTAHQQNVSSGHWNVRTGATTALARRAQEEKQGSL
ncbi:hypothetical protein RUM44_000265 [Polyplax serrata]|uniref:Uncharacterized protein n=1 Tax=Polyplax serrata TaxID=468196 RepID=A0ABR1B4Y4_POLSC